MHTRLQSVMLLVIVALVLSSGVPVSAGDRARQDEPVTLYTAAGGSSMPLTELDPQRMEFHVTEIESLFLGLTNVDPIAGVNVPELATSWTVSDDGRVWTFTLRDDVPWVHWDPAAGEAAILRMVTAHDVAYGIARACDPRARAPYVQLIDHLVSGCSALASRSVNEITDDDYELVQARALDDVTLEIHLQLAAGYFLSWSVNPILRAVPPEVIEQYGQEWTQPGTMVTNGPFMLDDWRDGRSWTLVRNPYLPDDLRGPGNVERVVTTIWDSDEDAFQAYARNEVDLGSVPYGRLEEVAIDPVLAAQVIYRYRAASQFYVFANDVAPFDNVHVRRAFSAALDRAQWCHDIYGAHSLCAPMIHFTPPGLLGAPPIDEVGVGFDPDYARAQLALAGYPGCDGFPEIRAVAMEGIGFAFGYLAARLEEVLGCDPALMRVEEVSDSTFYSVIDSASPEEYRPQMWHDAWIADYPDANNFLGDYMHCGGFNGINRPCSEIDDLIDQAAANPDLLERTTLYRDIEERLFGPNGQFPIIPIHTGVLMALAKPWVEYPATSLALGSQYDWYTIDQAAQLAARRG